MKPALSNTVRVKAFQIPKEAFPDPAERAPYVPFADQVTTVRSRALCDVTTMVRRERLGKLVTLQIWGIAVVLVAVLVVLFR